MPVKERVLDEIRRMRVADLVDLARVLESEISSRNDMAVAVVAAATGTGVSPRDFVADQIAVIKAVREITDLGLREARDMTDTDDSDHDGGPEEAGMPAWPKRPSPCREDSERMEVPVRPRLAP